MRDTSWVATTTMRKPAASDSRRAAITTISSTAATLVHWIALETPGIIRVAAFAGFHDQVQHVVHACLANMGPEIVMDEQLRLAALLPIERMVAYG